MKKLILILLLISSSAFAQIPSLGSLREGVRGGYEFDGVTQYVTSALTQKNSSVSFWILPTVTNQAVLNFGTDMGITFDGSNVITYGTTFAGTTTYVNGIVGTTLTLNSWNHVVCVYTEITPTVLEIGRVSTTYFTGNINLVRVFSRALVQADINLLYNNGRPDLYELSPSINWSASLNLATIVNNVSYPFEVFSNASTTGFHAENSSADGVVTTTDAISFTSNKYRMSFTCSAITGTAPFYAPAKATNIAELAGTLTSNVCQEGSNVYEFTPTETTIGCCGWWVNSGNTSFTISNFSITKIGCVAEYLPFNRDASTWYESFNGLNGSTYGSPKQY